MADQRFPNEVALVDEAESTPDELAAARLRVAWMAADRHGCMRKRLSDPPCRVPGHAADVELAREWMVALGLVDDTIPIEITAHGKRQARCSGCGRKVYLTVAGVFQDHAPGTREKVRGNECAGSGRPVNAPGAVAPEPEQPARIPAPKPVRRPAVDAFAWMGKAACRGESLSLFFGHEHEKHAAKVAREKEAAAVCGGCWVRSSCLQHALTHPEKSGVWGQFGEEARAGERRRFLRREAKARGAA